MDMCKGKGSFYIAQYPVRWTAQSALQFPPLADLFIPTPCSASPGSILAMQQLRAMTKSLTFPPLSIARYSFIQLSRHGRQWREGKCPIFQTVAKGDSNPGSLDCESGILPLSYRAPLTMLYEMRKSTISIWDSMVIEDQYTIHWGRLVDCQPRARLFTIHRHDLPDAVTPQVLNLKAAVWLHTLDGPLVCNLHYTPYGCVYADCKFTGFF